MGCNNKSGQISEAKIRFRDHDEYGSLAAATSEIIWLQGLFDELDIQVKKPIDVYCDSKAVL